MDKQEREHEKRKRIHIRKIIQREVSWFNGWQASNASEEESCDLAAQKILRYLRRAK
jgi:hypothetical protein